MVIDNLDAYNSYSNSSIYETQNQKQPLCITIFKPNIYSPNGYIGIYRATMALNYIEIDKILDELSLETAVLQKVKAINYESFTFSFYKPGDAINIQISLDNQCRIHRESSKYPSLGKSHNLIEFLKAYLVGGRVINNRQLNNNRIIEIEILKDDKIYLLLIRLWGGFSNIIITDKNYKILHLHKKSNKKDELPGKIFIIPPPKEDTKQYKLQEHDFPDYNSYIEDYYKKSTTKQKLDRELKTKELYIVKRSKEIEKQIKNLNRRVLNYKKAETYKLYAHLILSNIHQIQKGDLLLKTINYLDGTSVEIPLNPELPINKNSDYYYKKYQKAESGLAVTLNRIKELEDEKENIELTIQPKDSIHKKQTLRTGLNYTYKGWEFLVGRNARENDKLLRGSVKGNDLWFHIRDYPGGYVFIKNKKGQTVPLEILKYAGSLALYYSKGKNNGKADITYTHVKHLRRVKKGKLGQVIVTMDKNIYVTLNKNILYSES